MNNKGLGVSAVIDVVALLFVYMIPVMSRYTSFPLYLADPMRLAVLATLFFTGNRKNTLIMALIIPMFSFFVSGHPVFPKCLLIAGELSVNVLLFVLISGKLHGRFVGSVGVSMFVSILLSKVLYYIVKAVLVAGGTLVMDIFSTEFGIQLAVAAVISILFEIFVGRR